MSLRVAATPERAFESFTREIGQWWLPNGLFQFTRGDPDTLTFEPGPQGRLTEIQSGGDLFEIGHIKVWQPPARLVFSWRQASFAPAQETEVHVCFEPVGDETRITVEHLGWDTLPAEHVARHGFPDAIFLRRHAEWWRALLDSLGLLLADGNVGTR